jgi:hypothetical protein
VELAEFEVEVNAVGHGRVVVNDEDLSREVSGVTVSTAPGQPTVLTLHHLGAAGRITGQGVVHVVTASAGEALAELLGGLDAEEIERLALERMAWQEGTLTTHVMAVLRELSAGA